MGAFQTPELKHI